MTQALPAGKPRFVTPYRIVVSVLLAGAAAGLYVALHIGRRSTARRIPDPQSSRWSCRRPTIPQYDRSRIYARLADGYTGVLDVNGVEIPEDQLDRREGLSAIGYTPGPDTETGALRAGQSCARVIYWPITQDRSEGVDSYRWCWTVS